MNENKHEHPHTEYKHEHGHDRGRYWRRAHRDWKFWVALVAMLVAMGIYLRTNDLSVRPHGAPQQPVP